MKTRTYHLVCFFVLLATLGIADAVPCHPAQLTAQVQSTIRYSLQLPAASPHPRAATQPSTTPATAASTSPVWLATLPPAHTAALQTHTTRA